MDWPVIGAIGAVTLLAVAVTATVVALVRPEPPMRAVAHPALLRSETQPEVSGPNLSKLPDHPGLASTPLFVPIPGSTPNDEPGVWIIPNSPDSLKQTENPASSPSRKQPSSRRLLATPRPDEKDTLHPSTRPQGAPLSKVLIIGVD